MSKKPVNPFASVAPRKKEFAPEKKKIVEDVIKEIKKNSFFVIYGERGVGRTLIVEKIVEYFKKKQKVEFFDFDKGLLYNLKKREQSDAKSIIVVETVEIVDNEFLDCIFEELIELHRRGNTIIITTTVETFNFLKSKKVLRRVITSYKIPNLTYDESRDMIVERLNEVRTKKSDSVEPFTEKEVRYIWKKSKGNPKMILLICSFLYHTKAIEHSL